MDDRQIMEEVKTEGSLFMIRYLDETIRVESINGQAVEASPEDWISIMRVLMDRLRKTRG